MIDLQKRHSSFVGGVAIVCEGAGIEIARFRVGDESPRTYVGSYCRMETLIPMCSSPHSYDTFRDPSLMLVNFGFSKNCRFFRETFEDVSWIM